jgi:LysR family transcriptional regulator, regulator for bpeEF and oprC
VNQLMAIRAFTRVVEAGSFTRAAESLGMPGATLSKTVRELEAHLGVRLLERTTRRVSVTAEGVLYYEKAGRLLRDLEDIDASFGATGDAPRGLLRVDVGGASARDVLIPALPGFMQRYPDIHLALGVSDRPLSQISEHVDCVIRIGALADASLLSHPLGEAQVVTCASPAYLERHGVPGHPDELRHGHRLVSFLSSMSARPFPFRFARGDEHVEIIGEHALGINESSTHLAAATAGLGVIQTFVHAALPALDCGTLVEVLPQWRPAALPLRLIYPQTRHMTHRLRVFVEWMEIAFPRALHVNR